MAINTVKHKKNTTGDKLFEMEKNLDTKAKTFAEAYTEIAARVPEDKKRDFILACDMFVTGLNVGKQKEVSYANYYIN